MTKRTVCVPDDERGFLTAQVSAIGCRIRRGTAESFVVVYTSISVEATTNNPQRGEVFHDRSYFAVVRMTRRLRLYISPQRETFSVDAHPVPLPFIVSQLFLCNP